MVVYEDAQGGMEGMLVGDGLMFGSGSSGTGWMGGHVMGNMSLLRYYPNG